MPSFKFNVMEYLTFGALVGVVHFALSWVIGKLGGVQVDFATVSVAAQREAFGGIGTQLLKFSPFDPGAGLFMSLLVSVIAGVAIAIVGRLIYGILPVDSILGAKTPVKRVATILASGSLVISLVLVQAGLPGLMTFIGLAVWAALLGWIVTALAGFRGSPVKIPQN